MGLQCDKRVFGGRRKGGAGPRGSPSTSPSATTGGPSFSQGGNVLFKYQSGDGPPGARFSVAIMARHLRACRGRQESEAVGANVAGEKMSEGGQWWGEATGEGRGVRGEELEGECPSVSRVEGRCITPTWRGTRGPARCGTPDVG